MSPAAAIHLGEVADWKVARARGAVECAAQAPRRLLHGLLADPSLSVVVCGLVVMVFLSGAVWFVVFACLPCSPERAVVLSF